MSAELKEKTRKALVAQTSEVLVKKLMNDQLMGISKEIAIEILESRKEKGSFKGEIPVTVTAKGLLTEEKVKKEKVVKEKKIKEPKTYDQFPDWVAKFKRGDKVKFSPNREKKSLTGEVISSYPYKPKNSDVREDLKIRVGDKTYIKNSLTVERV